MSAHEIVLIDADEGIEVQPTAIEVDEADWRIESRILQGGPSDGVSVVEIDNGLLTVRVLPTRGMSLWNAERDGVPIGWNSPVTRPVHPSLVDQSRRGGIGWLDGFNELLVRCGLGWHGPPCDDGGTFLTLHGRAANIPAHRVAVSIIESEPTTLSITGVVDEVSLFDSCLRLTSTLITEVGSSRFEITDVVKNLGDQPAEMELLYHVNVGPPFLGPESKIMADVEELAPRDARAAEDVATWDAYRGPSPGYAEQVYFARLQGDDDNRGRVLLCNADGDRGFALDCDLDTLPYFALWKNTAGERDGYVTGLEPCSSLPNARPFERERGRVISLGPEESRSFRVGFDVATTSDETERLAARIDRDSSGTVHRQPIVEFSPA